MPRSLATNGSGTMPRIPLAPEYMPTRRSRALPLMLFALLWVLVSALLVAGSYAIAALGG